MRKLATSLHHRRPPPARSRGLATVSGFRDRSSWESLWEEFFKDPSQWQDNRAVKLNPNYPDFTHKRTGQPLWLNGWCARNKDLLRGTAIHHELAQRQLVGKCFDDLAIMYANCDQLGKAKVLLSMHKSKNAVAWTALAAGYVRKGQAQRVIDTVEEMEHEGLSPNSVAYACALLACGRIRAADKGRHFHNQILSQGLLQHHIKVQAILVGMYSKCGNTSQARQVLVEIPFPNVVCWGAMIAGYVQEGEADEALICLQQMQQEGILPDLCIFNMIFRAWATTLQFQKEWGSSNCHPMMGVAVEDVYANCGVVAKTQWMPKFAWNALLCMKRHADKIAR